VAKEEQKVSLVYNPHTSFVNKFPAKYDSDLNFLRKQLPNVKLPTNFVVKCGSRLAPSGFTMEQLEINNSHSTQVVQLSKHHMVWANAFDVEGRFV